MPFPKSQRVIYKNNPLVEVICQLRFPTILEIGSQDPAAFQKKVRSRYPLYATDEPAIALPKEISGLLGGILIPRPSEHLTHKFLTDDSKKFISLNRDFLAITDQQYQRWEEFREDIRIAKTALEEVYQPSFYSRIGLRYRDVIDRTKLGLKDETWDSLLNSPILGVLAEPQIRDRVQEMRCEVLIKLSDVPGGFVRLRHGLTGQAPNGNQYLFDADFFTEDRRAIEHAADVLDRFNRLAGNLFRWAITHRLQHALGPTRIADRD